MAKIAKISDYKVRLGLPLHVAVITEAYEIIGNDYVLYTLKILPFEGFSVAYKLIEVEFSEENSSNLEKGNKNAWKIQRRFSEIATLHETLAERFVNLPTFPSKTIFRSFAYGYIQKRMAALNSYFDQITKRRDVMSCEIVHAFLNFSEHSSQYMLQIPQQTKLINAFPSKAVTFPPFSSSIVAMLFDSTNQYLVVGSSTETWMNKIESSITLWMFDSNGDIRMENEILLPMKLTCLCFDDQEKHILIGSSKGNIQCLKRTTQGLINCSNDFNFPLHTNVIQALAVYAREGWLFSAGADAILRMYSLRKNSSLQEIECSAAITCLLIDASEAHLFAGYSTGEIGIFDLITTPIQPLAILGSDLLTKKYTMGHNGKVTALAFDAQSSSLFAAKNEFISIWNVKDISRLPATSSCSSLLHHLPCSITKITSLHWCEHSAELLCGTTDGAIVSVLPSIPTVSYFFEGHLQSVTCIAWNQQRCHLFTAGKDCSIIVWKYVQFKNIGLKGLHFLNSATSTGSFEKLEERKVIDKTLLKPMRELSEIPSKSNSSVDVDSSFYESISTSKEVSTPNYIVDPLLGMSLQAKD